MAKKKRASIKSPKKSKGDYVLTSLHAAAQAVPFGGTLSEVLKEALASPYEKRMAEWQAEVNERLNELNDNGELDIPALADNPLFLDVFIKTHRIATSTREQEKRQAALNALINVATNQTPTDTLVDTFLKWLDDLTVYHIQILAVLANPMQWFQDHGITPPQFSMTSNLEQMLIAAIPSLQGHRTIYDQITSDLNQRGLIGVNSLHATMTASGAFEHRATSLGSQFLGFIRRREAD